MEFDIDNIPKLMSEAANRGQDPYLAGAAYMLRKTYAEARSLAQANDPDLARAREQFRWWAWSR